MWDVSTTFEIYEAPAKGKGGTSHWMIGLRRRVISHSTFLTHRGEPADIAG